MTVTTGGKRSSSFRLRRVPAVETVLRALGDTELPRPLVARIVRQELSALRKLKSIPSLDQALVQIRATLVHLRASRIQPVINGTGILLHTNFGRAPLGAQVLETLTQIGGSYNSLEYDRTGGGRGARGAYLEACVAQLCGSEDATVVNNNAAALVLILRHFCGSTRPENGAEHKSGRASPGVRSEVIISRGELLQIGGGFRIPEILEASCAQLREVGTTNKTSLNDYARAISPRTALILKVHRSNFFMDGFVSGPLTEQVATLAHEKRIPFVEDLGSGALVDTQQVSGLEHEPTPAESVRHGADLVCFSGDKLMGGPQAGLIAGKAKLIAALRREPLFRALRCDKLILSALQTTLEIYLREAHADIPILEMLAASTAGLRARAEMIVAALAGHPIAASIGVGQARLGGGSLPRSAMPSITVDLGHSEFKPQEIAARLRQHAVPIVGYIARGTFKLDLRTVFPRQDAEVVAALRAFR